MLNEETISRGTTIPDVATPPIEQPVRKNLIMAVLLIGAFVAILNQTLLNIAIPEIMKDLEISASQAQWLMTGYMLIHGVLIPASAFLMLRFPTRALYVTAMGLFSGGTLVCATAPFFAVLMAGRFIQAAGAAVTMPLLFNGILSIYPFEQRGRAMGVMGMCIMFAPAIGPPLSGWLVQTYAWRSLFWVVLPISLCCVVLGMAFLKTVTELTYPRIDLRSLFFSTLGFGGVLYGVSLAGTAGWSSGTVLGALSVGGVGVTVFVRRQFALPAPMLDFRVFRYGMFALTAVINAVLTMAMFSGMILVPLYMQSYRGFSPLESGLLLLPGAILMGVTSPIAGWVFDKAGGKWLAVAGLTLTTLTTWQFSRLTDSTPYSYLITMNAIRMFGMALLMMPINTTGLNQLPSRLHAHGTAMNNTVKILSGSLGTAFLVTWMTLRSAHHAHVLPERLASIQGVNDAFFIATLFSACALFLSFFIQRVTPDQEDLASIEA